MNPCETPCEKCGSADVYRQYIARDSIIKNETYNVPPCRWTTGRSYTYRADRDLLKHHCRTCQYEWVGKPLARKRNPVIKGAAP